MACERDLWQEHSGMRSRMNHPGRRCRDGFVPWLTSVPMSQETGLSKQAEMPLLCQPRASGADVRLCAFFFFYGSTLKGLLGTGRTSQTKHNINLPSFSPVCLLCETPKLQLFILNFKVSVKSVFMFM